MDEVSRHMHELGVAVQAARTLSGEGGCASVFRSTALSAAGSGFPALAESAALTAAGSGLPTLAAMAGCSCAWNRVCPVHVCQCRVCSADRQQSLQCSWRLRHGRAWARLGDQWQGYSYFKDLWNTAGIDANGVVTSPRERDLLSLIVAEQGGLENCEFGVLDLSQSHGWHQWRNDGCIPTLATGSQIFLVRQGQLVPIEDLLVVMGFPSGLHISDFEAPDLTKLLGNTMHVGVVGLAIGVLVGLQQA